MDCVSICSFCYLCVCVCVCVCSCTCACVLSSYDLPSAYTINTKKCDWKMYVLLHQNCSVIEKKCDCILCCFSWVLLKLPCSRWASIRCILRYLKACQREPKSFYLCKFFNILFSSAQCFWNFIFHWHILTGSGKHKARNMVQTNNC